MNSVKLPLSPMWRLFDSIGVNTETVLFWYHAGIPNLSPAERYILDIASGHRGSTNPRRLFWSFDDAVMPLVSELLIDAQEDADEAVMLAWLRFDPSLRAPTSGELAERTRGPGRVDVMTPATGPHFSPRRKGGDHVS